MTCRAEKSNRRHKQNDRNSKRRSIHHKQKSFSEKQTDSNKDFMYKSTLFESEQKLHPLEESLEDVRAYIESGGDLNEAQGTLADISRDLNERIGYSVGMTGLLIEDLYILIEDYRNKQTQSQDLNNFKGSKYYNMAEAIGHI